MAVVATTTPTPNRPSYSLSGEKRMFDNLINEENEEQKDDAFIQVRLKVCVAREMGGGCTPLPTRDISVK